MTKYPSQLAERFQVRLPDGLRDEIKEAAKANGRSMNAEIVERLQGSGKTLRDEFAGLALAGLREWTPPNEDGSLLDWTDMEAIRRRKAEWAYAQADAMLAARRALEGGE